MKSCLKVHGKKRLGIYKNNNSNINGQNSFPITISESTRKEQIGMPMGITLVTDLH
jgi:hypothetical protein